MLLQYYIYIYIEREIYISLYIYRERYIYIYIERERERDRDRDILLLSCNIMFILLAEDLKPSNILVELPQRPKLLDFGLSHAPAPV